MSGRELTEPVIRARSVISGLQIRKPAEILIEEIAFAFGAIVRYEPLAGADGRLVRLGDRGVIRIREDIPELGRRRFVIAHELGHLLLGLHQLGFQIRVHRSRLARCRRRFGGFCAGLRLRFACRGLRVVSLCELGVLGGRLRQPCGRVQIDVDLGFCRFVRLLHRELWIARLRDVMAGHVANDSVGGLAWAATCGDEFEFGVAGHLTRREAASVRRDSIFRIASMSKPIAAVAAMILVEECVIRLDDPVDGLLPELADRRVLVDGRGSLDGPTVPAHRPITLHDVLTFRLGWGMDFAAGWPQPLLNRMGELGLGGGPPNP